jgi:peptidoglycan-N-acetylglucosamine deacetylase
VQASNARRHEDAANRRIAVSSGLGLAHQAFDPVSLRCSVFAPSGSRGLAGVSSGFGSQVELLKRWRRFPGLERLDGGDNAALTFDDGPDPDATPLVLDALEGLGIRATFFLVGEQAEEHPELAREIARRGHEVALHCFEHVGHDDLRDPAADLARGLEAIERLSGERPRRYRPPYGLFVESSYNACREHDLEPVLWSAWAIDWEALSPERIAELVRGDLEGGTIVLLHDSPRYAPRASAAPTAQALPLIADGARERGLALGPVGG